MHEFKDPAGLARAAVIAVFTYMGFDLLLGMFTLAELISPSALESGRAIAMAFAALAMFVAMIVSFVIVGRWIYRASANAHSFSSGMTISPGWAVGSYFIPILNLFRPFQGMKEAWLASHHRGDWQGEPTPGLLGWWWALWIITNILNNISFRMSFDNPDDVAPPELLVLDLSITLLNVPLCLILVSMMRQLTRAQVAAHHEETFA